MSKQGNTAIAQKKQDDINMSLIYSRLAVLENQKQSANSSSEISNNPYIVINIEDLDSKDLAQIDLNFEAILSDYQGKDFIAGTDGLEFGLPNQEMMTKLHQLIASAEQKESALKHSFDNISNSVKQLRTQRDLNTAEIFRLRQDTISFNDKMVDMEKLCRNFQSLTKEKNELSSKLLEVEVAKTATLRNDCEESISKVTVKMTEEEEELNGKQADNDDLCVKLEQFREHLEAKKLRTMHVLKQKELELQLEHAKLDQKKYLKKQAQQKKDATLLKISTAEATVSELQNHIALYQKKFLEFEDTLVKSAEIMAQFNEREASLLDMVTKLREEHSGLKQNTASGDVAFIRAIEEKRRLEAEVPALRTKHEKLEKKCRALMTKRKELSARLQARNENVVRAIEPYALSSSSQDRYSSPTAQQLRLSSPTEVMSSSASPARASKQQRNQGGSDVGVGSPISSDTKHNRDGNSVF